MHGFDKIKNYYQHQASLWVHKSTLCIWLVIGPLEHPLMWSLWKISWSVLEKERQMLLMPPFYESNGFLTSIFHKQRQRLSEYRLCLCTCGIRTIEHIAIGGTCIPAFNDLSGHECPDKSQRLFTIPIPLSFREGGEEFFPGFLWLFF